MNRLVIEHLRRIALLPETAGQSDRQLLERFRHQSDDLAFEALVRRHGPMVFGVCQRVLGNHHDAEDAFQATFLVLARKASSVTAGTLANWLFGVAYRTALKAKVRAAKNRAHERRTSSEMPTATAPVVWSELPAALDEELDRLAAKHRIPFILCELQGHSQRDAARQLGWPEGTLFVRLMRAKKLLAKRLSQRGFGPAAGVLSVLSVNAASAHVARALIVSTAQAANAFAVSSSTTGLISAEVAILTQGVLNAMLLTKIKIATAALLVAGLLAVGTRPLADVLAGGDDTKASTLPSEDQDRLAKKEPGEPKTDLDRLQGSWQVVRLESSGKVAPEEVVKKAKYVFKGNEFTVFDGDQLIGTGDTLVLDPTKKPKAIDLMTRFPAGKEQAKGIYRFGEDTLEICIGNERPTEFSGAGKNGLIQFKRIVNDPGPKSDIDRLQGSWRLTRQIVRGKFRNVGDVEKYAFKGNEMTVFYRDKRVTVSTFTLDPVKKPKSIDFVHTEANGTSRTGHAIYRIEFGSLDLCFGNGAEPTNFTGEDTSLQQFERIVEDRQAGGNEKQKISEKELRLKVARAAKKLAEAEATALALHQIAIAAQKRLELEEKLHKQNQSSAKEVNDARRAWILTRLDADIRDLIVIDLKRLILEEQLWLKGQSGIQHIEEVQQDLQRSEQRLSLERRSP